MDDETVARAILAKLYAARFGRPVPREDLEAALAREGIAAGTVERLVAARLLVSRDGGLVPGSIPRTSRAPEAAASGSWLHR